MKIAKLGAVAVAGIAAGALALAGSASAGHNTPEATVTGDDCTITGTTAWAESDGPHLVANTALVVLVAGEVHTALIGDPLTVEDLPAGTTSAQWRIWGGGERDYDSPALSDLDALVEYLDAAEGNSPLDADAPGVVWNDMPVDGCPAEEEGGEEGGDEKQPAECVDVNTADAEELTQLRHIDADRAQQILDLRPFTSVDDLGRINGIAAGGPRLAELVAGGDGFLPLCDIAAPGGEGGSDEELAQTGFPTGSTVGIGAGLLVLGGAGYLVARRRRVSFTAA